MGQGCPGRGMLMRPSVAGATELKVLFMHDCKHDSDGTKVGQLRGGNRRALLEASTAMTAAHAHIAASGARTPGQQLDHNVSTSGSNAHVVRQARYEVSVKEKHDTDEVFSAAVRKRQTQLKDKADTPDEDHPQRLFYGETPFISEIGHDSFVLLRMTDHQLRRWEFCRGGGCSGLVMDTMGGMVSD